MTSTAEKQPDTGIELLSAPGRADLDKLVLDLLAENVDSVGRPRFLYLSPTRRKTREMAERLKHIRPSWRPNCLVPGRLAERMVSDLASLGYGEVTPELKELLVLRILEPGEFDTLCFKDSPTPAGIARHVIDALDTLARKGLSPLDTKSGLSEHTGLDLETVRMQLDETLKAHRLQDSTDVLCLAAEALRDGSASWPENTDLLLLDGFVAPDKIEADFLAQLVRSFSGARVVVTLPTQVVEHVREPDGTVCLRSFDCIGTVELFLTISGLCHPRKWRLKILRRAGDFSAMDLWGILRRRLSIRTECRRSRRWLAPSRRFRWIKSASLRISTSSCRALIPITGSS
jgi:hypothetical protein